MFMEIVEVRLSLEFNGKVITYEYTFIYKPTNEH